jgi:SNF2 family DNA or RNA helicase
MIRREKEILNLPPQTIRMETVPIDNRNDYQILHNQYMQTGAFPAFNRFANQGASRLSLTTQMLMTTARGKARAVVQWLQKALADQPKRKIIVFCTHTGMLDVIYRRVSPGRALMINGTVSAKKRTKIVEQFETSDDYDIIVCNIIAAGAGITLNAATLTVLAELPWSPRHVLQAKDRNWRIGQNEATEVVFLVAEDTIEEKLCRVLTEKENIADTIVDGKKKHQLNTLAMLQEAMLEP